MSARTKTPERRELGDASGRAKPERLSEYFDFRTYPDKRDRRVTRGELLALLTRKWLVEREQRWYRRLWRFLSGKLGSDPAPVGGGAKRITLTEGQEGQDDATDHT